MIMAYNDKYRSNPQAEIGYYQKDFVSNTTFKQPQLPWAHQVLYAAKKTGRAPMESPIKRWWLQMQQNKGK